MVESELIADVRAGNRGAFAALVETYQAGVYNLCNRMLGDAREAEDAAQETFLRSYSQLQVRSQPALQNLALRHRQPPLRRSFAQATTQMAVVG
jgi:DNA-directed RNA polymerase specialized sigma24 family protein